MRQQDVVKKRLIYLMNWLFFGGQNIGVYMLVESI